MVAMEVTAAARMMMMTPRGRVTYGFDVGFAILAYTGATGSSWWRRDGAFVVGAVVVVVAMVVMVVM